MPETIYFISRKKEDNNIISVLRAAVILIKMTMGGPKKYFLSAAKIHSKQILPMSHKYSI